MRASLALLAMLLASSAHAQEELAIWLEELRAEPLDLRTVEVDELARLPWLDRMQAEAIIGLRESGGLGALEDLLGAGILDAGELRAIEAFVFLRPTRRSLRLRAELWSSWLRQGGPFRHRAEVVARLDGLRAQAQGDGRASLWWEEGRWRFGVGHLRLARDRDLLRRARAARSRSGPLSGPHATRWLSRPDSLPLRAALQWSQHLSAAWSEEDFELHVATAHWRTGTRVERTRAARMLLGYVHESFDLYWTSAGAANLLVASARAKFVDAILGFDGSRCFAAMPEIWDPISGRVLDRPQQVEQLYLRWSGPGHSSLLLLRRLRRGLPWQRVEEATRILFERSVRAGGFGMRLRSTLDRERDEVPQLRLALQLQRALLNGVRHRIDLRWQPQAGGDARLYGLALEGGRGWQWELALSRSDGERAVFDARGLGGGARSIWLAPGSQRLALSVGRRSWALWLDSVRSAREEQDFRLGLLARTSLGGN